MINLLVTGGAGFIGSGLIQWLLSEEARPVREALDLRRVVNLDALTYAGNPENLRAVEGHPLYRFVHGDITDVALVRKVFLEEEITSVIHLAAETHVDRSIDDPTRFYKTNVEGTLCLLEAARRAWTTGTGQRFVHVSTDEVFGSLGPDDPPFTEASPYAPNSPYAASKAAGDHFARAYFQTYGLPVVTTHSSNVYGMRQFPEKLIPLMILTALERKPLPVYGDGQQIREWLFIDDCVRGLVAALMRGRPGESYVFGPGTGIANLDLVRTLCARLDEKRPGPPHADLITFVQDRPGHDRRYALTPAKAHRDLGWLPQVSLAHGLNRTLEWYISNRGIGVTYQRARLGLGRTDTNPRQASSLKSRLD